MMNMINASTGLTPLILKTGHSPGLLPPLIPQDPKSASESASETNSFAHTLIKSMTNYTWEVRDALLHTKVRQAHKANKDQFSDPKFKIGDKVLLTTAKRQQEYMQKKDGCVAKFMPWWDGPFEITHAYPKSSSY
jgi:hypothetical protein